jgi:TRAP-type C4-dicarboxylate transport system permease small subunit
VGFLGGSIATAEQLHLKVDAAEKLFQGDVKRWVGTAADVVAGLFTGFLGVLGLFYCRDKYALWAETDGAAGLFPGLPIPMWFGYGILPLTFLITSLRFIALGWLRWNKRAPEPKPLVGGTEEAA